ncbi:Succinyl-diaminopimelate desuccinylase [Candidatus Annandia adelgestsuga]|uniref:Succinyl-diaminopimelate desuccinylase n=1 Tax=Candidatus Annandia adelgestsuga TaxID=1302411 RepID=A0A3Q9CPE0_9ENTR|nr:succinyl-diaminopimelate desuccinylase [Candidatus Annandia adelgestsuga]AZP36350.1 Succinyl-diaminopimelate desuccinylase [Candidatus Annandia adelgestsuga]
MLNIISLFKQLIKCPSLSPLDSGCQIIINNRLKKIGFNIKYININKTINTWAYRGVGKNLLFAGHTDVVSSGNINNWITLPFIPILKKKKIFGRGSADMKGSLAAIIIAIENFIKYNPNHKGQISLILTSDEESDATDGTIKVIKKLKKIKKKIDYCIIGEPSSKKYIGDNIKNGRRGSLNVNLIIYGKQGHIAYPNLAKNPIHESNNFIKNLILNKWGYKNIIFEPTILQISNIYTDNINNLNNIIPNKININFNLRFNNEININKIINEIKIMLINNNLKYYMKWKILGKPFYTNKNNLLDIIKKSIYLYNKKYPKISTEGGTSDGRFIYKICKQIVELGLKNKTIHKFNEYINIIELKKLSVIYQNIIKNILL